MTRSPCLRFTLIGLGLALLILLILDMMLAHPVSPAGWATRWIAAMSVATFAIFGADKSLAKRHGPRIPEAVLLGMSLLGGSPGAIIAMLHTE